ncbi:hypothetical protein BDK51DRAFT_37559 [Blyttiomyces helicus]|uniref:Uncharacterized protein n=1 Tax=Blyttiomyces helicus TaxID=388810 RepID=A0A4P9W7H5_9FUNG|nr:hypothetical protein BDK51DRAFT_37559 [Blyttiomyces helicus]|eukprot:RKO88314.1 hypothetical protein BDK51DRAFT_37559 [Blyttiomyces helicus]
MHRRRGDWKKGRYWPAMEPVIDDRGGLHEGNPRVSDTPSRVPCPETGDPGPKYLHLWLVSHRLRVPRRVDPSSIIHVSPKVPVSSAFVPVGRPPSHKVSIPPDTVAPTPSVDPTFPPLGGQTPSIALTLENQPCS